jgi:hypothetical protein
MVAESFALGASVSKVAQHCSVLEPARRKFVELADIAANTRRGKNAPPMSPIALEAVKRIDALFAVEREIKGLLVATRLALRQEKSAPPGRRVRGLDARRAR